MTFGSYGTWIDKDLLRLTAANTPVALRYKVQQFARGISVVDNSRITMANQGKYNIAFSAQLANPTGSDAVFTIWLRDKNGDVPWSSTDVPIGSSKFNNIRVAAWNFFVNADEGDSYQIMIAVDTVGTKCASQNVCPLVYAGAATNAAAPQIPSLILTVNQVG